ncbi:MAG TPA: type I-E CRISPR-associated protein Cas6/Cse3/CasE, partial [Polyangiaceae bacterium]
MVSLTVHQARLVFASPQQLYELHRDLCRAFAARREGKHLFRTELDRSGPTPRRVVLVHSDEPGDFTRLSNAPVSCESHTRTWQFTPSERFRFFLRANPTQAKKATLHEFDKVRGEAFRAVRGKRVALRGDADLLAWLCRQGDRHGFRLAETEFPQEDGTTVPVPALRIAAGRDVDWRGKGQRGHHAGVDFEGILVVERPDALAGAVRA